MYFLPFGLLSYTDSVVCSNSTCLYFYILVHTYVALFGFSIHLGAQGQRPQKPPVHVDRVSTFQLKLLIK